MVFSEIPRINLIIDHEESCHASHFSFVWCLNFWYLRVNVTIISFHVLDLRSALSSVFINFCSTNSFWFNFFFVLFRTFEQFTSEIIRWNRAKCSLANIKRIKISSRNLMREVDKKKRVENFLSLNTSTEPLLMRVFYFLLCFFRRSNYEKDRPNTS